MVMCSHDLRDGNSDKRAAKVLTQACSICSFQRARIHELMRPTPDLPTLAVRRLTFVHHSKDSHLAELLPDDLDVLPVLRPCQDQILGTATDRRQLTPGPSSE